MIARSFGPAEAEAAGLGRACAVAVRSARELMATAEEYPELFPPKPFDAAFFSGLALSSAFGSPWAGPEELRAVNLASLCVFAVDWQAERACTAGEMDALIAGCLAAAGGEAGGTPIARLIAELRGELAAACPSFGELQPIWAGQLHRTLLAMATELRWKREAARVTLDDYLANADGCGASFVNISHWIATGDPWTLRNLAELREVSAEVQRYLRLLNDLATSGREREWGDLSALTLGAGREEVIERMAGILGRCRALLEPVRAGSPRVAAYLERQIGFNTGFYGVADYWGEL